MTELHHETPTRSANTSPAPRWLLWFGVMGGAAALGGLFAFWGIEGPKYLFDLVAAYCF